MTESEFEKTTATDDMVDMGVEGSLAGMPMNPDDIKLRLVQSTGSPPYSAICQLTMKYPGGTLMGGTAFLVGNGALMATAAHNIHNPKLGTAEQITVKAGTQPLPQPLTRQNYKVSSKWLNNPVTGAFYDYGFIIPPVRFNVSFSLETSLAKVKQISSATIAGYPCQDSRFSFHITRGDMYEADGAITGVDNNGMLIHRIDTIQCMSGSPIFCKMSGAASVALGIHTAGSSGTNKGVSINADFVKDFMELNK